MEVPLNIIHNYIGFPVLLGLGIDTFRRYKKNNNVTSLYVGLACLSASLAEFCYGMPVLFTHNQRTLSITTLFGDILVGLSMMSLWFLTTRAFLSRWPKAVVFANTLVIAFTGVVITEALFRNLTLPYKITILHNANGGITYSYADAPLYTIFSSIDSLALVFMAIFFWRQGKAAPTKGQRLRIRSFATSFILVSVAFIVPATMPENIQFRVSVILWSIAMLNMALFNAIGSAMDRVRPA
jgi:hypothetical protein